jgi:hypothetical protein
LETSGLLASKPALSTFWRWAFSDLCDDTTRGILAEFLVARVLVGSESPTATYFFMHLNGPPGLGLLAAYSATAISVGRGNP